MNNTTMSSSISSSDASTISLINVLNRAISQFGFGFIFILGNVGSILMCIVFTQPTYRNSPCAMFFLSASVSQFFTYNFALFTRMLHFGYAILTLNSNLWYCKLRFYLFYIFVAVPRYYIILASIDRYFASSDIALRRRWSSQKIALRLIFANVIFWSVIYTQIIVFYEIGSGICTFRSGHYAIFFTIYIAFDSGVLPILLMLIFGLLTVRNVRQTKARISTNVGQSSRMSKKDVQLHRMLANQIILFVILNMPNPIYLIYSSFTVNMSKSALQSAAETFVSNMTYLLIYLGFSLTFTNFMISSDIFRREFAQILRTKILRQTSIARIPEGGTPVRMLPVNDGDH
ncbi:unnamed protein product [Adineta ricciae]|uniref:G-protein coupled receptors family 1 profile domain-containing protein n=1 Tax=Adineta ricciae TaxID=249248 RepID=A0A814N6G6_ADIRI|nr:unnamed protein product [Adineta ricciae]CAF1373808.1 unnamed protein product [Adineta ricciae]